MGRLANRVAAALVGALSLVGTAAVAVAETTVHFTTNVGSFDVSLTDAATPVTVANFLSYVNSGAYNGTFIHRSVPGFVIQGGGYSYDGVSVTSVTTSPPIVNEFAQAKAARGGGPVN